MRCANEADPALAEEVKQGKTKLADAVKKVAAKKSSSRPPGSAIKVLSPRPVSSFQNDKAKERNTLELKRHDERMKSARYKLEAFVRDYADMSEWTEFCETIKTHPEMKGCKNFTKGQWTPN